MLAYCSCLKLIGVMLAYFSGLKLRIQDGSMSVYGCVWMHCTKYDGQCRLCHRKLQLHVSLDIFRPFSF